MTTDIDIFAGVEFCDWPSRSDRKPSTLRLGLHKGIDNEVRFLEGPMRKKRGGTSKAVTSTTVSYEYSVSHCSWMMLVIRRLRRVHLRRQYGYTNCLTGASLRSSRRRSSNL